MSETVPSDLRELLVRIDARLSAIVGDIAELKADAKELRKDSLQTRVEMATINGKMSGIPNVYQTFMISFGILIGLPALATVALAVAKAMRWLP